MSSTCSERKRNGTLVEEEIYILGATILGVLDVRHAIDVMHLTKNFCVNLIAFLGVYEETKDTVEAHQELQRMEKRDALHPQQRDNGRQYLSLASNTLSKEEKETMFDCLSSIKVPSGYSSNIKGILNLQISSPMTAMCL